MFCKFFFRSIVFGALLCLGSLTVFAQKKVERDVEFWPQYYIAISVDSTKWSVAADYSDRYSDFDKRVQWIGRVGLNYELNKLFTISAGYAYSEYFSGSSVRRENRPWQQVQVVHPFQCLKLNHRLRLEERFQRDQKGDKFNYRLRYQFMAQLPLMPKQKMYFFISDEPMINFGDQVKGNIFDQNRLQAGMQIKVIDHFYITPALQNTYQIQSNKVDYKSLTIWRTGITYKW